MSEMVPSPDLVIPRPDRLRVLLDRFRNPGRVLNIALSVIVLLVALTPFLSPANRDLFGGDETRYSEIVREMSQHHSLLVLTLDGQTYTHKPPLHFWLIYVFTRIFGDHSAWPYVLPSLLSFGLALGVIRSLALRMFGRGGMSALFVFCTFYMVWATAQIARMDAGFAALIALGMLFLWNFLEREDPRQLLFASIAIGLSMLTKGPMALVILLVTLLLEWTRRRRLPRGAYGAAMVLALVIPLVWVLLAGVLEGPGYVRELLIDQNVGRMVQSFAHQRPVWFYFEKFPVIFFPWVLVLAVSIAAGLRGKISGQNQAAPFLVSWMVAVIVPFSLISGKLEIYMLPAFAPAALLIAGFLTDRPDNGWAKTTNAISRAVVVLIGLAALAIALSRPEKFPGPLIEGVMRLRDVRLLFWSTAAVALIALAGQLFVARRRVLMTAVIAGMVAIYPLVYTSIRLMPVLNSLQSTAALVHALERQNVNWSDVWLVESPHLWSREKGDELVKAVNIADERDFPTGIRPRILVAEDDHAFDRDRLAGILSEYRRVGAVFVRGHRFIIYRYDR
jgi:4-amino-4-deoxy-L-arabinose transferase-like glycosyltransferase